MSFRRRVVLLAAGAVAAAVVIASVVVYVATRNELRSRIDASLRAKLALGQPQAVHIEAVNPPPQAKTPEGITLGASSSGGIVARAGPGAAAGFSPGKVPRGELTATEK
jgi:hypothetical protein